MCQLAGSNIGQFFNCATGIIANSIIPVLFALAVAFFVWGAIKFFIINADEEAKRSQGKQFMIWGIVALAVMLSVWGIVKIITTTFGTTSSGFVLPGVAPRGGTASGGGGGGRTCPPGTEGIPPACTTILPPHGDECTISDDCRLFNPNAYCAGGYCVSPI